MLVMIKQTLPKVRNVVLVPGLSIMADSAGFHVFIVKKIKFLLNWARHWR